MIKEEIKMTDGTRNNEPVYCPVNCWNENDCPYAKEGKCCLEDAPEQCDDFGSFFSSWEEWERA